MRGRQTRSKINPDNFAAPPDYATVIIENEGRQSNLTNLSSENYGSFNTVAASILSASGSSELAMVETQASTATLSTIGPSDRGMFSSQDSHETSLTTTADQEQPSSFPRTSVQSRSFRFTVGNGEEEEVNSITISNAEPVDTIKKAEAVEGACALPPSFNDVTVIGLEKDLDEESQFYSVPDMDNAVTEYTTNNPVTKKKVPTPAKRKSTPTLGAAVAASDSELEVYSAASTLSLGETVILSDGWLDNTNSIENPLASLPICPTNSTTNSGGREAGQPQEQRPQQSTSMVVLNLNMDTSSSVI